MRVLIVGGSPEPCSPETLCAAASGCDAVVAVDRGLDALRAACLPCDLFCGDADSVSAEGAALVARAEGERLAYAPFDVERDNPHKDFTDLSLALRAVRERWGACAVRATCLTGGAPDHFLAALGRLTDWDGSVELFEDAFLGRVLRGGDRWAIEDATGCRFSFVPLSSEAEVSERGMRWELDCRRCSLLEDLGISNVIESDLAVIECHEGAVGAWVFRKP